MTGNRPVTTDPEMKLIKRKNAKLIARSALALTLSAAMGTAMVPVPALAEAADQEATATEQKAAAAEDAAPAEQLTEEAPVQEATAKATEQSASTVESTTAETAEPSIAEKLAGAEDSATATDTTPALSALAAVQTAAEGEAPTFDPNTVVYNAGDVSMTVDGESQGTFSVFQVATSWTAGTPTQDADGNWTCTLTIVPKDENKIAGHFGDSGYVLDEANSKRTLTYHYNKWSGWHAYDKTDRATVAYKKGETAPIFDASQAVNNANEVEMHLDGESQGSFSVSQVAQSWTATDPKQDADGNWTVDLTFVPKDENKIAGHFSDSGYVLDEENSKLTLTYEYNKWQGWHAYDKAEQGKLSFKKAEVAPAFDASAVNEANDVKLLLDGEDQGSFSVSQVVESWTAADPVQGAYGCWTVDVTFVPKDENKIAGHFGDSGYELDSESSKLTVTYQYNKFSGWHAFDKANRGTLAFKKAVVAPEFDLAKQNVDVVIYDADEFDPAFETSMPLSADTATAGEVYQKDGKWAVDVTLKQGKPEDYGVADHTSKGVYLFDDANSVTEVTYVTSDLKSSDWKPEEDGAKIAFAQVLAPTSDDIVNAQVTVKTTDGSKEKSCYLGYGTYEVGPVVMGYTNPMCVVTLKADKQQEYVDEFNEAQTDGDNAYVLAAAPNDIQFYFSYDPDTQEWTNTTTDQYIYVKKAEVTPTFDSDAVNEAGDVKLLLDGEDQGSFSVSQVAASWTAADPVQDADSSWTVDVTFVPKDENKIAGHFGDSGYELDSENSKLTVTYTYSTNGGWKAIDKADRGVLAFKKAANPDQPVTPENPTNPTTPENPTEPVTPEDPTTPAAENGGKAASNADAENAVKKSADKTAKKEEAKQASTPDTSDSTGIAALAAAVAGTISLALAGAARTLGLRRKDQ